MSDTREKVCCYICGKTAVKKRLFCTNCRCYVHVGCNDWKNKRKCCDSAVLTNEFKVNSEKNQNGEDHRENATDVSDISDDEIDLNRSIIEKSFNFENNILKEMNRDLRNQVKSLEHNIQTLQERDVTVSTKTEDNLTDMIRALQSTINDNFKIFLTEIKDIRLKLASLERKNPSQRLSSENKTQQKPTADMLKTDLLLSNKKVEGIPKQTTRNQLETHQRNVMEKVIHLAQRSPKKTTVSSNNHSGTKQTSGTQQVQKKMPASSESVHSVEEQFIFPKGQKYRKRTAESDRINTSNPVVVKAVERKLPLRRNHKRTSITGTGITEIKTVPKKAYLYVTRISKDTSTESLTNSLKKYFPEVVCEKLDDKYSSAYLRFKVTIDLRNIENSRNPEAWPVGAEIRRFFHPRPTSQTTR